VPRAVTTALRLRSVGVLTAQEDEAAQLGDDLLLQRAADLNRVLVSQDEDLLREGTRRLREGGDFCGIVYAHQRRVRSGKWWRTWRCSRRHPLRNGMGGSNICRPDEIAGN
jgi:hypothetical protein